MQLPLLKDAGQAILLEARDALLKTTKHYDQAAGSRDISDAGAVHLASLLNIAELLIGANVAVFTPDAFIGMSSASLSDGAQEQPPRKSFFVGKLVRFRAVYPLIVACRFS